MQKKFFISNKSAYIYISIKTKTLNIMATFQEIVQAAQDKGLLSECFTAIGGRFLDCPVSRYASEYSELATYVTVKISAHRYATWEFRLWKRWTENTVETDSHAFFSTYNQVNGATQKTWRKEQKALQILGL